MRLFLVREASSFDFGKEGGLLVVRRMRVEVKSFLARRAVAQCIEVYNPFQMSFFSSHGLLTATVELLFVAERRTSFFSQRCDLNFVFKDLVVQDLNHSIDCAGFVNWRTSTIAAITSVAWF